MSATANSSLYLTGGDVDLHVDVSISVKYGGLQPSERARILVHALKRFEGAVESEYARILEEREDAADR